MSQLELFAASLTEQTYPEWELSISFEASARTAVQAVAEAIRAQRHCVHLIEGPGETVTGMLRAGIAASTGEYLLVLQGAGVLVPLALQSMLGLAENRRASVIYADEDRMEIDGQMWSRKRTRLPLLRSILSRSNRSDHVLHTRRAHGQRPTERFLPHSFARYSATSASRISCSALASGHSSVPATPKLIEIGTGPVTESTGDL